MSFIAQYTAHIITAAAIFLSIFLHWLWPKRYWQPVIISALISSAIAHLLFRFVPRVINGELVQGLPRIAEAVGFAFVSSFVLAMLIGYLMKFAPSLFKK